MTTTAVPEPRSTTTDEPGWTIYLVRTSGLLLVALLAVHLVGTFLSSDVQSHTMVTFTERWSSPLWRALDWALVILALMHGALGLRPVISSGTGAPRARGALEALLFGLVGVLMALVTFVAFTFRFA